MLKRIIILIAMVAGIAFAANGYCTEFMVWNPATKDTLVHFSTKAPGLPELKSTYWDDLEPEFAIVGKSGTFKENVLTMLRFL